MQNSWFLLPQFQPFLPHSFSGLGQHLAQVLLSVNRLTLRYPLNHNFASNVEANDHNCFHLWLVHRSFSHARRCGCLPSKRSVFSMWQDLFRLSTEYTAIQTASVVQWSEFLATERTVLHFLWGTNWIYICYVEESRLPLWSTRQNSWLHNGNVLCFLWGTNWTYISYV
jgi:hypothetical protein